MKILKFLVLVFIFVVTVNACSDKTDKTTTAKEPVTQASTAAQPKPVKKEPTPEEKHKIKINRQFSAWTDRTLLLSD